MIPFFRRLRRHFLDQNQVTRYLLYALGEIALVVIGILIALQVDTWNGERIERREMRANINALRSDLARDTVQIQETILKCREDSTRLGDFQRRLSVPDVSREDIVQMARYEYSPWIFLETAFNDNTYKSLQATGEIRAIPDLLKDALMDLNTLQQRFIRTVESDVDIYLQSTIRYGDAYPFRDVGHIDPNSRLADRIWDRADMVELGAEFNALIGVKYSAYYAHIPVLEDILDRTRGLLQAMQDRFPDN